jgi:hypothetical protein
MQQQDKLVEAKDKSLNKKRQGCLTLKFVMVVDDFTLTEKSKATDNITIQQVSQAASPVKMAKCIGILIGIHWHLKTHRW